MTTPVHYFATKYDSAADEVVAMLADPMEGYGSDDYFGDVDSPVGYVQPVSIPADVMTELEHSQRDYPDLLELVRTYRVGAEQVVGHHVVVTNSSGLVSVVRFVDEATMSTWVAEARAIYEAWDDQD